jgi:DNA-binding transcriptional ArsR family regulator
VSVGALAESMSLHKSAVSQHLAKLRAHNLVETRKERRTVYYSCRSKSVRQLLDIVASAVA